LRKRATLLRCYIYKIWNIVATVRTSYLDFGLVTTASEYWNRP
jgi:hypothetical protein